MTANHRFHALALPSLAALALLGAAVAPLSGCSSSGTGNSVSDGGARSGAGGGGGGGGGGTTGPGGSRGGASNAGGSAASGGGATGSGGVKGGAPAGGSAGGGGALGSGTAGGVLGRGGAGGNGGASGKDASAAAGGTSGPDGAATDGGTTCALQATGEMTTSLSGTWTFTPSGTAATTIEVPGGGWIAQGFSSVDSATYQRTATVPNLGIPQVTYVEFGAINHQATLSVDSTQIGTNTTSFTPSVFDVTAAVQAGASHQLTVAVKGRKALIGSSGKKLVPDAAGWSPNVAQGIFRSADIRAVPVLHVLDALVHTDVAADQFSIDVWVRNGGTAPANGTIDVALSSWSCSALSYPTLASVPVTAVAAGTTVKVTLGPVTWGLGSSSYWWPNVPYTPGYRTQLHNALVTLTPDAAGGGSAAAHSVPFRFGFRQIVQNGPYYELNGVRVNFRGDNIQGADYDSINNTGKGPGDSYDLFAGFAAPSANNAGWPQAVDNWQHLNYNVTRIHQEPATPYMLDVLDEMGFMAIEESAIRGSNNDQDFVAGLANMTGHLDALVRRDRNHPAVLRWSQDNEPEGDSTNSASFQQALYQTVTADDDTRPVSADPSMGPNAANMNGYPTAANFSVMEHYPSGFASYTDHVDTTTARPFGVGEFIWSADNTKQGLAWFATSTMALRQQDSSDIRPYTLLSGWAGFVPGVKTTMMSIEQGGHPLFGEDNLPDPWSSPIITRIQRAFSPVAVADVAYWSANHESNTNGDWPVALEAVSKGAKLTRQLVVFNDTFTGTTVDVAWEMHSGTATGTLADQGTTELDIPLGSRTTTSISVTAPSSGSAAVLILQASKNGQTIFSDDGEQFTLN